MAVNFNKLKQEILAEHNKVRANPQSYIPILKTILGYFKKDVIYKPGQVSIQTEEGQKVYQDCIKFLEKQKPIGTLVLNDNLSKAAQDHCNDIGPKGLTDHDGSDGNTVTDRIEKYLQWDQTVAENLDFGGKTGEDVLVSLIVDDGNPDRGHRKTIFNNDLKILGIGIAKHIDHEVCTCLDYVGVIKSEKSKERRDVYLGGIDAKQDEANPEDNKKETPQAIKDVKIDLPPADFLFGPKRDLLKDDPDKPDGATNVKVQTIIKKVDGESFVKIIKTYTLGNGKTKVVTLEQQSES